MAISNVFGNWRVKGTIFWGSALLSAIAGATIVVLFFGNAGRTPNIAELIFWFFVTFFVFWMIIYIGWWKIIGIKTGNKDKKNLLFEEVAYCENQFVFYWEEKTGKKEPKEFNLPPEKVRFCDLRKKLETFEKRGEIIASLNLFNLIPIDVSVPYFFKDACADKIINIVQKYGSSDDFKTAMETKIKDALKRAGETVFYAENGNVYAKKTGEFLIGLNLRNQFTINYVAEEIPDAVIFNKSGMKFFISCHSFPC